MLRVLPLFLTITACAPVIAETPDDPAGDPSTDPTDPTPDPACDATFEVASTWAEGFQVYGAYRGLSGFDGSTRFVHHTGVYESTLFDAEVATGEVRGSDFPLPDQWPMAADDDLTLVLTPDGLLIREAPGRTRGVITGMAHITEQNGIAVDGGLIAVSMCPRDGARESAEVFLFDADGVEQDRFETGLSCWSNQRTVLDLHAGTRRAVFAEGDRAVVLDLDTGDRTLLSPHTLPEGALDTVGPVPDVRFSADGRRVASGGMDGVLRIHDTDSGRLLEELDVATTQVNANIFAPPDQRAPFAWSSDGELLARLVDDTTIEVTRTCDGEVVAELAVDPTLPPEHTDVSTPSTLHFAPDRSALVAVYEGGLQGFVAE